MTTIREPEWLTVEQFRIRHHLGRNLVYDMVRQMRLRSVKLGGKILIASDALEILAESQAANLEQQYGN